MYDHIQGDIWEVKPTSIVIRTLGIGFILRISLTTYSAIKDRKSALVFTYLHVSENAHTLFGFHDGKEREMFLALISVTGVGPSTALNILSYMTTGEIEVAVIQEDRSAFKKVKGIGEKSAAQIVLDLKNKVGISAGPGIVTAAKRGLDLTEKGEEAISGLVGMGFTKTESRKRVDNAIDAGESTLDGIIRYALKNG